MHGLGGRTYIVTGAASGIGRATAARLLDEGARVMGADIADAAATPSGRDGRGGPLGLHPGRRHRRGVGAGDWCSAAVDVRRRAWTAWSTRPAWPGAGRCTCCRPTNGHRVIAVNLTGTYLTAKHVITQMLRQPAASTAARVGGDGRQHRGARRARPAGAPTAPRRAAWSS